MFVCAKSTIKKQYDNLFLMFGQVKSAAMNNLSEPAAFRARDDEMVFCSGCRINVPTTQMYPENHDPHTSVALVNAAHAAIIEARKKGDYRVRIANAFTCSNCGTTVAVVQTFMAGYWGDLKVDYQPADSALDPNRVRYTKNDLPAACFEPLDERDLEEAEALLARFSQKNGRDCTAA